MNRLFTNPIAAIQDRFRILSQLLALSDDERALWLASQFIIEGASIQEWTVRSGLSSSQVDDYLQHRLVAATWIDGRETERKTLRQALKDWTDEIDQHLNAQGLSVHEESYDDIIQRITSQDVEPPSLDYEDMERWYLSLRAIMDTFDHINLPPTAHPPAYYERETNCPPDPVTQATRTNNAPTIRLLYEASIQSITSAASHMTQDVKRMKELATRMKIWGMDLFTGLLPLDELLNPNDENTLVSYNKLAKSGLLRYNLIGIWADVAATLEHLLRCLIGQENTRLQSSWNSLLITLSLDEVANAVFDEPELLSEQSAVPVYDVEIVELCICRLEGFVSCLFDLLVNIGTLRQVRLSSLTEELSTSRPKLTAVIRSPSFNQPQRSPVDSNITVDVIKQPNNTSEKYITLDLPSPPPDPSVVSEESNPNAYLNTINYTAIQPTIRDWNEKSKNGNWSKTSGSWVFQRQEGIPWHAPPGVNDKPSNFPSPQYLTQEKKQITFKDEVESHIFKQRQFKFKDVFESDDREQEEDEDTSDWEDPPSENDATDKESSLSPHHPQSKPTTETPSSITQPPETPKTTRRSMLTSELTDSLRKHLLEERRQRKKITTADTKSSSFPPEPEIVPKNTPWNEHLDNSLEEYHQQGL